MRSSSAPQRSSFSAAFVPLARKLSAPLTIIRRVSFCTVPM